MSEDRNEEQGGAHEKPEEGAPERTARSPHPRPVADVVEADRLLHRLVILSDDRDPPHVDSRTLERCHRSLGGIMRREYRDDGWCSCDRGIRAGSAGCVPFDSDIGAPVRMSERYCCLITMPAPRRSPHREIGVLDRVALVPTGPHRPCAPDGVPALSMDGSCPPIVDCADRQRRLVHGGD